MNLPAGLWKKNAWSKHIHLKMYKILFRATKDFAGGGIFERRQIFPLA